MAVCQWPGQMAVCGLKRPGFLLTEENDTVSADQMFDSDLNAVWRYHTLRFKILVLSLTKTFIYLKSF